MAGFASTALARIALSRGEPATALAHAEAAIAAFGCLTGCAADALATVLVCAELGHRSSDLGARLAQARALAARVGPRAFAHRRLTEALARAGT